MAALLLFSVKGLFKYQKVCFLIIAISLLLTFAKGGIVIAMITGAILVKKIYKKRRIGNALLVLGILLFAYALLFSVETGSSGSAHLAGLLDHIRKLPNHLLGTGIGSEGNLAINMAGLETESSGESFIGTVIGQLGIGIFLYVIYAYNLYRNTVSKLTYNTVTNDILKTTNFSTLILFLTSLINNTAISFTSCFIYIIILGIKIVPDIENECEKKLVLEGIGHEN